MPVDSVDNYTVFRVIHSIAFRSSVFCSADKVREVVESYFAKTFFCRFLVLSIPGERWILQTVPGFSFQKLLRVYQHHSWGYLTTLSTIRSAISR